MKKLTAIILISTCMVVSVLAQPSDWDSEPTTSNVRFAPLHVYVDSGAHSLAAYQFELNDPAGLIKIVGVEGGEHPAFEDPPYYDPAALANNRIIIAAFNTADDLPTGRTRVATVHLHITGDAEPDYELGLTIAADTNGEPIPAQISFEKGE